MPTRSPTAQHAGHLELRPDPKAPGYPAGYLKENVVKARDGLVRYCEGVDGHQLGAREHAWGKAACASTNVPAGGRCALCFIGSALGHGLCLS